MPVSPRPLALWHVYPLNDLYPHNTETEGIDCWCKPVLDEDLIVIHNAADGRERYERGLARPH